MATITLSQLGDLMKKVIEPVLQDQLFRETVLLNKLQKNKGVRKLANGTFYVTAKTGGHSGVYNVAEGDVSSLEDGNFSTAQMTISSKYAYGRHTFTDIALEGIEGDEGALADLLVLATDELKDSMKRNLQRQFHGFGQGVLAQVNGASTGTTVTVDGPTERGLGTQYIFPGMKLSIGTKAQIEAGTADPVTVVAVISETQFTISTATTIADNDLIVKQKAYNTTGAVYTEMSGIQDLIDSNSSPFSSTFQGLSRSTYDFVNSNVYKPGTSEVLTLGRMIEYYLKSTKYGNPDLILMNSDLFAKYGSLLEAKKQYVNIMKLDGGFSGLEFAGGNAPIPVVLDYDTEYSSVQMLDTSSLTIGEMAPVSFVDRDGQVLRNVGGNSAVFSAIMRFYGNLICLKPKASARLTNMKSA